MSRPINPLTEEAIGRLRPSISPHVADPQGWQRLDNVWASRDVEGGIESVPGYIRAISSAASEDLRGLIYAKANDGTKLLLAVGATSLFKIDLLPATFGTITTLATGLTYGQQFGHVVYDDTIYLFNGTAAKQITIASTPVVSNISSTRPDVTNASTSLNGSGNVRGVVKYFLAQMTGTGDLDEGALSVEFGKINAKNGKKVDVDLTHADFQSNVYRIYRTHENGEDPFLVAEVDVPAAGTTYTDNTPDFGDGGLGDPPLLNGDPPPNTALPAIMHLERAWVATSGSELYYSDTRHPESWFTSANGNRVRVRANDGDDITALGIDGNDIVIWKHDHMYRLIGLVEEEFAIVDITQSTQDSRDIGTPSVNTVTAIPGGFAFYWNRAIYTLSRGRIRRISDEIESHLTQELDDLEDQIHLGYDSLNGRLWVSLPINRAVPSHTYYYSFKDEFWVGRGVYGHRAYTYVEDDNDNLELWAVGAGLTSPPSAADRVYQVAVPEVDFDGEGYRARLTRPVFSPGSRGALRRLVYLDVDYEPSSDEAELEVSISLDSKPLSRKTHVVPLTGEGSVANRRVGVGRMARWFKLALEYESGVGTTDIVTDSAGDEITDADGQALTSKGGGFRFLRLLGLTWGVQSLGSARK